MREEAARGSRQHAARLFRGILANDEQPFTAHHLAATTAQRLLPAHVRDATEHRAAAVRHRAMDYERWRAAATTLDTTARAAQSRDIGAERSQGEGLVL